jgi:hypothetical protein
LAAAPSKFDDKPYSAEGTLARHEGEYRVRYNEKDTYILVLNEKFEKWCNDCAPGESVKIKGTYRQGGKIEVASISLSVYDETAHAMVREVNKYRKQHGLRPLQPIRSLLSTARIHSRRMRAGNGMWHGGTSGWSGENVAMGQANATEVTRAWYNSSGHRANMLNPNFRYIGVGHDQRHWTQQFK